MAHKVLRILALLLAAGTCLAEDAVVAKGTVMKADRSLDQPQSFYGNAVKKAEVNAAKHDDSLVKPANEVMDDTPPK